MHAKDANALSRQKIGEEHSTRIYNLVTFCVTAITEAANSDKFEVLHPLNSITVAEGYRAEVDKMLESKGYTVTKERICW